VTVPCLRHPYHIIDTFDQTPGPHDLAQALIHLLIGRLPLRTPTLTHRLLHYDHLREARTPGAVHGCHGFTPVPQAGTGLTHQLLRHGLGPLLLRPVAMVQGSLITQQPSSLAPCWTVQFYQDSADVPLHSLPVAETSAMW
jgi:hypothetical protein